MENREKARVEASGREHQKCNKWWLSSPSSLSPLFPITIIIISIGLMIIVILPPLPYFLLIWKLQFWHLKHTSTLLNIPSEHEHQKNNSVTCYVLKKREWEDEMKWVDVKCIKILGRREEPKNPIPSSSSLKSSFSIFCRDDDGMHHDVDDQTDLTQHAFLITSHPIWYDLWPSLSIFFSASDQIP